MSIINVYTDGSSRGNPGPGGYAIIIEIPNKKYKKIFYEGFRYTTNNRMELLSTIIAMKMLNKINNKKINFFTDSKYIVQSIEKKLIFNWKKNNYKNIKNVDLWENFLLLYNNKKNIFFTWIKGHNKHPENDYCHKTAFMASKKKILKIDIEYEKINPF